MNKKELIKKLVNDDMDFSESEKLKIILKEIML